MFFLLYLTYRPLLRRYHVVCEYIRTLINDSVTHHFSPQEISLGKISLIDNTFANRRLIWDIKWVNPKLGVNWNYHLTPEWGSFETRGVSLKLGSNYPGGNQNLGSNNPRWFQTRFKLPRVIWIWKEFKSATPGQMLLNAFGKSSFRALRLVYFIFEIVEIQ